MKKPGHNTGFALVKPTLTLFFCLIVFFCKGQSDTAAIYIYDSKYTQWVKADTQSLNHCNCDSLKLVFSSITVATSGGIQFCGAAINGKRIYGLNFVYSAEGKLTKIEKYYEGKVIGECKIE